MGSEVEALADAAPTLKEAELRVLLELTRRQLHHPGGVRISSRDLATHCKLSRGKLQAALDSLAARSLITTRQGTPTSPAVHRVNILDTVRIERIGGSRKVPPRLLYGATLAPKGSHPPQKTRQLRAPRSRLSLT